MKTLSYYQLSDETIYHFDDNDEPEFGDGMARYCSLKLCQYSLALLNNDGHGLLLHKAQFMNVIPRFFLPTGEPIRHYYTGWWSKSGTASGDQLEPLLCCYLVMGMRDEFLNLMFKILKRGGFAWNTKKIGQHDDAWKIPDFVLFRFSGLFIRGLSYSHLYRLLMFPVILLWDLLTLSLTTLVRTFGPYVDKDNTGDDLNFFHKLVAYYFVMPTPVSFYCRSIYYALRPPIKTLGPVWAFRNYYAGNRNPPLDDLLSELAVKL